MELCKKFIQDNIKQISINTKEFAQSLSIKKLVELLKCLDDAYYTSESLVSDTIYDQLFDVLKERSPTNPYFKTAGAPDNDKLLVPLPIFAPSQNKIKLDKQKPEDTEKQIKKYADYYSGPYVVSDKLDGMSGILQKAGKELKLFTKGNGAKGQNISALIPFIIPEHVIQSLIDWPDDLILRGECIVSEENYKKHMGDMKNARSLAASLINSKNLNRHNAALMDLVVYNVLSPSMKQSDQLKLIEKIGIKCVNYKRIKNISQDILSKNFELARGASEYDIDGIIVTDDSSIYDVTRDNPDYSFAYKESYAGVVTTKILDVIWNVSKDGYLVPIIHIETVTISGVDISNITAYNAKYILSNNIGIGTIVEVERSGDVIPHIVQVVKSTRAKMPSIPFVWDKTNTNILVSNPSKEIQEIISIKKIYYFFGKLGVKYMAEATIEKFVKAGYDNIIDIIAVIIDSQESTLDLELRGVGDKVLKKIYDNIRAALTNIDLSILMSASGMFGRNWGQRRIKEILNVYPDILKMNKKINIKQNILEVPGFDDILASAFEKGLPAYKAFQTKLLEVIDVTFLVVEKNVKGVFAGMSIVFTGIRDLALATKIEEEGGSVKTGVSKNTSLIICADKTAGTSSLTKAEKLGIPIFEIDEFKLKYHL